MHFRVLLGASLLLAACGSDPTGPGGPAPTPFPAFKPEMPQLVNQGGATLTAPEIVTVTWSADPNAATFEAFGDGLGASSYWKTGVGEYGIGEAQSGPSRHVRVATAPPATMTTDELDAFVVQHVESDWPKGNAQTVYVVYAPPALRLTDQGQDLCADTDGFHTETTAKGNAHVVYAVVAQACGKPDVVPFATGTAAHEIAEAATDPHTGSDLGWVGMDAAHLAWTLWLAGEDENADACQSYDDASYDEAPPFAFNVQRLWSNASAAAGHNPCVPAPSSAYFNTTPLDVEDVTVTAAGKTHATKGFRVGVGQTRTFRLGFYSDAAAGPWEIAAVEGDAFTPPSGKHLTLVTDRVSGQNGDVATITVTVDSAAKDTAILMTVKSMLAGSPTRYMPIVIGAY